MYWVALFLDKYILIKSVWIIELTASVIGLIALGKNPPIWKMNEVNAILQTYQYSAT